MTSLFKLRTSFNELSYYLLIYFILITFGSTVETFSINWKSNSAVTATASDLFSTNSSNNLPVKDLTDQFESNDTISTSTAEYSLFKCKSDSGCIDSHSICLNGTCRRICNHQRSTEKWDKECIYFHCDGKISNLIESKRHTQIHEHQNKSTRILIETNNYPLLRRYLSNKKCSWILKNLNEIKTESFSSADSMPFIRLDFERFSTQLSNDYLYIFAGDSIFSPLIAALSGTEMASNEPSATADYEFNEYDSDDSSDDTSNTKSLNITFLNMTSIYLLFKSDVTSQFQPQASRNLNDFQPNGISIKYKFSGPCTNETNGENDQIFCTNKISTRETFQTNTHTNNKPRQIETVNYIDNENSNWIQNLNSSLRRAFHCSFVYKNYFYSIGGYSFSSSSLSFVSRLNLNDLKWEHNVDKFKLNKQSNRSNRRLYSDNNFRPRLIQQKQAISQAELPQSRYAHSCVLDENNNQFYMYGGIKYESLDNHDNKQITNELWKYNLINNKWLLLNSDSSSFSDQNTDAAKEGSKKLYILPIGVAGHSMTLIRKNSFNNKTSSSLLIFFGFSEYYGSTLNIIQEYNLSSKTWRLHNTLAFNINIGFAHTAVPDLANNIIYLYGGLNINSPVSNNLTSTSDSSNSGSSFTSSSSNSKFFFDSISRSSRDQQPSHISSKLYSYDLKTMEWKQLTSSTHSSYLHSSIFYKNYLLIYGGILYDNTKVDSSLTISSQLRIYDINRNKWFESNQLDYKHMSTNMKFKHRQRYSHSSFIFNDSLHIFAGFNGFFLNDLFKFNLKSSIIPFDCTECDWIPEISSNKYIKRQLIYPTNGDDPILLQQPLFQDITNQYDNPKSNMIDISRNSKQKQQSIFSSIETCNQYGTCHTCQSDVNCIWNLKRCEYYSASSLRSSLNESTATLNNIRVLYKKPSCGNICNEFKSCFNCTYSQNECVWCSTQAKCVLSKAIQVYFPFGECINYITERNQCELRTGSLYSLPQQFSYSNVNAFASTCSNQYSNCSACIRDEKCGWCTRDASSENETNQSGLSKSSWNTGTGLCMEGGETNSSGHKCKYNWFFSQCPSCECNGHAICSKINDQLNKTVVNMERKNFLDDAVDSLVFKQNSFGSCGKCMNNTDGDFCSQCKIGYYGNPKNNGTCYPCECGKQTNACDTNNGRCLCNTKGVIGSKCDQCETPRYTGRPNLPDGSCYYNLSTDYQFTFNLNKESDRFYTRINFVNHPSRGSDDDIDFMVRCYRENALINISFAFPVNDVYDYDYESIEEQLASDYFSSTNKPATLLNDSDWPYEFLISNLTRLLPSNFNQTKSRSQKQQNINNMYHSGVNNYYFGSHTNNIPILFQINCTSTEFKYTFSNRDFSYAEKNRNSTFVVHVYDFKTPITIQIAFSRRSRIQLLHFFITFFGCLFSLLAIAFISWKTKQRYDRYRRQRQIIIQMEQMASRPFTRLLMDVTKKKETQLIENNQWNLVKGEIKNEKSFRSKKNFLSRRTSTKKTLNNLNDELNEDPTILNKGNGEIVSANRAMTIMPVAVEPLSNNKTAILTCILKLPQGGLNLTPKGSSPLVLASAYVQISSGSPLIKSQVNSNPDSIMFDEEQDNVEKVEEV